MYGRQLGNCAKKSFEGCEGTMTNFPIASASATVVQSTSDVEGLIKIWKGGGGELEDDPHRLTVFYKDTLCGAHLVTICEGSMVNRTVKLHTKTQFLRF